MEPIRFLRSRYKRKSAAAAARPRGMPTAAPTIVEVLDDELEEREVLVAVGEDVDTVAEMRGA